MGKILDTITVLFKGDTTDLARKKKEAEQLASDAAKNIKEAQASTVATNAALDNTNKTLTQTEGLTESIGEGIAAWVIAAHQASTTLTETLAAEKAHREQAKIEQGLKATKRGAIEVETALKGVSKQLVNAALGAFTVAEGVSRFKDVVTGTLDIARSSRNLFIDPKELDALGQSAKNAGGNIADALTAYQNVSAKLGGITGGILSESVRQQLKLIHDAPKELQEAVALAAQEQFGIPASITTAAKRPEFFRELEDIGRLDTALDDTQDKILGLNEAWNKFGTNIRKSVIDIENALAPALTRLLDLANYALGTKKNSLGQNIPTTFSAGPFFSGGAVHGLENLFPHGSELRNGVYDKINSNATYYPPFPLSATGTGRVHSTVFSIGDININAPQVTDAAGVGTAIGAELKSQLDDLRSYWDSPLII